MAYSAIHTVVQRFGTDFDPDPDLEPAMMAL